MQEKGCTHTSYHIQKINSKWINNHNIRAKTIKLLGGLKLHGLGFGNGFSDAVSKAQLMKEKINRTSSALVHQDIVREVKRACRMGGSTGSPD